jgi:hypothetical protein
MRLISFLVVSLLVLLTTTDVGASLRPARAYTVVLTTGKQLYGTFIGEDTATIQLRDASGVVLSIKKATVDLPATDWANTFVRKPEKPVEAAIPLPEPEKSVVEVAQEARSMRTGKSRIYTRDDLNSTPEISTSSEAIEYDVRTTRAETTLDESYWRKAAATFRKELSSLKDKKISAEYSCQKAREKRSGQIYGGNKRPTNLNDAFEEPAECKRFAEIQAQLVEAEWRWDEFTERARRLSVPWVWIE